MVEPTMTNRHSSSFDWSDWRTEITRRYRILLLEELSRLPDTPLWTTRCCKIKGFVKQGLPRDLYRSPLNQRFYAWTEAHRLRYAILSDKYGLHLDTEVLPVYDLHPSFLTTRDKYRLGRTIRKQATGLGYRTLVFYNSSPILSKPYFELLAASGLKVFFVTRLPPRTQLGPSHQQV